MLPTVIPEILITPFKYWTEGIQEGMYHDNELFTLVKVYGPDRRAQAYEDACRLADTDIQICITVSELRYCLWQNLKSYAAKSPTRRPYAVVEQAKEQTRVLVSS